MPKRKNKNNHQKTGAGFSLTDTAKAKILAVLLFALALVFLFSFFEKAGTAGQFLFSAGEFLVGKAVFLLPFFLVGTGIILFGARQLILWQVSLAFFLLLAGITGILGIAARNGQGSAQELAGWFGYMVSWPIFSAFGFWVGEIILGAVVLVSGIIFWNLVDRERVHESSFAQGAKEKVKKIFEPKFEVKEVEPSKPMEIINPSKEAPEQNEQPKKKDKQDQDAGFHPLPLAGKYAFPPSSLLEAESGSPNAGDIKVYAAIIKKTLANFDIPVEVSEVNVGPAVTQYAFKPAEGIKLARITALANDLSLALAAHPIRIEAPIPGRSLVGIEIPNKARATVRLRALIENSQFKNNPASLVLSLGKDVAGFPVFTDLHRMSHMLVAGATGSGKTIALSNIILSLIYRNSPSTLRFILVDPKRVEFPVYNDLPHLLTPVILDTQRAINALKWLIKEMERRFQVLSGARVRDIGSYHELLAQKQSKKQADKEDSEPMPYIVLIIDELADLMATRGKEMETMIVRLAQMARAVGIHLVLATQRPSVEVITGLIKANVTARVAFQVASQVDSRTILDAAGAEKLLGRGDMLFISSEFSRPKRIQGAYISDKDVKKVVQWIGENTETPQEEYISEDELGQAAAPGVEVMGGENGGQDQDPLYEEAKRVVVESKKASASLLQRRLKVGYARAARLLDILQERGVIGPGEGAKPREVYGASKTEETAGPADWFAP